MGELIVAETKKKVVVPTDKQRAVLDALKGGRSIKVTEANGKKTLTVLGPTGKPIKEQPKLDRGAVEAAAKKGWLSNSAGSANGVFTAEYKITDEGTKAKRLKAVA